MKIQDVETFRVLQALLQELQGLPGVSAEEMQSVLHVLLNLFLKGRCLQVRLNRLSNQRFY